MAEQYKVDIGRGVDQVPTNGMLGRMAHQSPEAVVIKPASSAVPAEIGDMILQLTSNTSLTIKVKGSDGVVRSVSLTLA